MLTLVPLYLPGVGVDQLRTHLAVVGLSRRPTRAGRRRGSGHRFGGRRSRRGIRGGGSGGGGIRGGGRGSRRIGGGRSGRRGRAAGAVVGVLSAPQADNSRLNSMIMGISIAQRLLNMVMTLLLNAKQMRLIPPTRSE